MPAQNIISATLADEDNLAILAALDLITSKLPFLISLTKDQRKGKRTAATKRQGYIKSVADAVKSFPNDLPKNYDAQEFLKDVTLMDAMSDFVNKLGVLHSNVDDTSLQLGIELMSQSDDGYRILQAGAKNNPQLKVVVEKIGTAFKGQGKKKVAVVTA